MAEGTFATAINCMDGRCQEPVTNWLKATFGVDFVDAITEPGADKALTEGSSTQVESVRSRVLVSVNGHGSKHVAIVGHHDCAGNPVSKEKHLEMTRQAVQNVIAWKLPVRVVGLWVDENWQVEVVVDSEG